MLRTETGLQATYQSMKALLLGMTAERSLDALLARAVRELARQPDVAMARIWLMAPGDICDVCPRREECPGRVPCLHLVASAGTPRAAGVDWSRLDGEFRRFPVGVRKVGLVAEKGAIRVEEIADDNRWIARPDWASSEGIRGFGGQPLTFRNEVLGVLGVFTRQPFGAETLEWLRIIADHAAAAIANARAFEQIECLRRELELENSYLREAVDEPFGEIVGRSPALRGVLEQIELVAPTEASVLIGGESGTGKELVAREIHRRSARAERPLIQVNCASIPRELYESEFFGHAKGAFTGAVRDREGRFTAAHRGTLFLDEVGEIPLELQSKLLRVLQEGCFERVGEERTREVDVRIIAATNRDLRAEVEAGRFREDLYYRLNVFPITVAPLRERAEDIPALAGLFVERSARGLGREPPRLTRAASAVLEQYSWPGNVRELRNVVERAVILSPGSRLQVELPGHTEANRALTEHVERPRAGNAESVEILTQDELREIERQNLRAALLRTRWKVGGPGGAAELLGVKPTTLTSRIRKLGLERPV